MKKILLFIFLCSISLIPAQNQDSISVRRLYDYYLTQGRAYENLEQLCTQIGNRLSGSLQAEQAVQWTKKAMYAAGADTVILQPCMVPHWVRGQKEKCTIRSAKLNSNTPLKCLALGGSVGTGPNGISANVIEVSSFEELAAKGEKALKGKIIFYNVFFDQSKISPMESYRVAAIFRAKGASYAAKYGAIGSIVRSMTSVADDVPHTGSLYYDTTLSKVKLPALAISYKAADLLHASLLKDPGLQLFIETHCNTLAPVPSFNVVGQINGSEKPNEFISAGGHLDSWDVGQGAHDDGAGIVQCIEMLAAFKKTGIKPKHCIRAVAFMNEENGLAGGSAYADYAKTKNEKHITALETDAGGFTPRAFNIDTTKGLYDLVIKWKQLFAPYLIERIEKEGGGADLLALEKLGVPCMALEPDCQRYFDIHHTDEDTFDKVNKRELDLGAGAIGALIYLVDKYY